MQGDFFILSSEKGYAPTQRKEAMQVMECWDNVMTVKCKGGCMTKEYDHFEKVTDLSGFKAIHRYEFDMEDRRSYHPAQRFACIISGGLEHRNFQQTQNLIRITKL